MSEGRWPWAGPAPRTASVPWAAALPQPGTAPAPARDYLAGPGEGLGHLAVPAPVAGGDEVGHAAALQERGRGHPAFAEDAGEGDHLHEPQADDGGFRVIAAEEAVAEPSAHGHDVLGRRREAWRCGPSHAHCGKACGGGGRSTGGEAGRLLPPAGPRVPLWSSEREKEAGTSSHSRGNQPRGLCNLDSEGSIRQRKGTHRGVST